MALDRVGFRDWWEKIEKRYRVRANIGMTETATGSSAHCGNQLLVIDNDGPTESEAAVITAPGFRRTKRMD